MEIINFKATKQFIYQKCVERVTSKCDKLKKPQIELYRDDKSLVSNFFNCKLTNNNKYLVTKRLLDSTDESGKKTGAVHAFNFSNVHEVLWGIDDEFDNNLFPIFSFLVEDIINSSCEEKNFLHFILCDNIVYAKYSTFNNIKNTYGISLLENFAIWDYLVDDTCMTKYLKTAIKFLYNKPSFKESFKAIFLVFTKSHDDYTHIDKRLYKEFFPELFLLFKKYAPTNSSLGIRVKTLIETDIIKSINQMEAANNNADFSSSPEFLINKKIINASSSYIVELEKIANFSEHSGTYIYGW